jgi:nitroreductase
MTMPTALTKKQMSFIPYIPKRLTEAEIHERANTFYRQMNSRRSVRFFSSDPVPEQVLRDLVMTAGTAPSGAHKQPWYFAIITDPVIKHAVREAAEAEERINYQQRFTEVWKEDLAPFGTDEVKPYLDDAPALIVVFKQNYRIVDGAKKNNYYVNESVGIAAGLLIAAIHNAGLVTLTHTPNPMKFLNEILGRPKNEVPILLMPVGFPAANCVVPELTRKNLDEIAGFY